MKSVVPLPAFRGLPWTSAGRDVTCRSEMMPWETPRFFGYILLKLFFVFTADEARSEV